jgi:betaine-aldehyde dehydrogenase
MMAAWKIGPPIATGNTVVLKPSETTPVTALMLAERSAGVLPAGVLNVVTGSRDTGRALVDHPIPELVSATGSVRTGIEISQAVAPALKRVHLELGGKAPAVVLADVDVDHTAAELAAAAIENAGQNCIAATRVLVARPIYDRFRTAFVAAMAAKRYGAPGEADVDYGPLNSAAHLERVEGFIARLPAHAKILTGGTADRRDGGYYFPPTVIDGLRQDDEAVQNEIFAPVVTLQAWDDLDEAVTLANGVPYGLAASIWTESHKTALALSARLDAGQITINGHGFQGPELPNGGFKASGHGNDMSVFAIDDYTRVKHVASVL